MNEAHDSQAPGIARDLLFSGDVIEQLQAPTGHEAGLECTGAGALGTHGPPLRAIVHWPHCTHDEEKKIGGREKTLY